MKCLKTLGLAGLVLACILPSQAHASSLEWYVPSTDLSGHVIEGSFVQVTSTGAITWVSVSETGNSTRTYNHPGAVAGGIFYAQTSATVLPDDPVLFINVSALPTVAGNYTSPSVGLGVCQTVNGDGLCTSASNSISSNSVVLNGVVPPPIPTLTEWAMIVMGLALAGAAAVTLNGRRRRLA